MLDLHCFYGRKNIHLKFEVLGLLSSEYVVLYYIGNFDGVQHEDLWKYQAFICSTSGKVLYCTHLLITKCYYSSYEDCSHYRDIKDHSSVILQ